MTLAIADRFWAKVRKTDTCWLWTAHVNQDGYGIFRVERRTQRAHRVAWELTHGPIPAGQCVCHRCDNPPCVNPTHLFVDTQAANVRDASSKGHLGQARGTRHGMHTRPERRACGERNGQAKLTAAQVIAIRAAYAAGGIAYRTLAVQYGVGRTTIAEIIRFEKWASLSDVTGRTRRPIQRSK